MVKVTFLDVAYVFPPSMESVGFVGPTVSTVTVPTAVPDPLPRVSDTLIVYKPSLET